MLNDIDIKGTKHGYEESHEQRSSKPTPLIHLETCITWSNLGDSPMSLVESKIGLCQPLQIV